MTSAAEQQQRRLAARCTSADEPAAQRWLAGVRDGTDPELAAMAGRALQGEVGVAEVVAAADRADLRDALVRGLAATLPGVATGLDEPFRMADVPLSPSTRAALEAAGLWSDEPLPPPREELERAVREVPPPLSG